MPDLWSLRGVQRSPRQYTVHKKQTLVKPPNPVSISLAELALFGSIFHRDYGETVRSPHSFCHAFTTAIPSFLVCLFPLSIAFGVFRTVLLASSGRGGGKGKKKRKRKTRKTDYTTGEESEVIDC